MNKSIIKGLQGMGHGTQRFTTPMKWDLKGIEHVKKLVNTHMKWLNQSLKVYKEWDMEHNDLVHTWSNQMDHLKI